MATPLGKRYVCANCGTQVLVTKSGQGTLNCCDKEMTLQEAKPLPSSD